MKMTNWHVNFKRTEVFGGFYRQLDQVLDKFEMSIRKLVGSGNEKAASAQAEILVCKVSLARSALMHLSLRSVTDLSIRNNAHLQVVILDNDRSLS